MNSMELLHTYSSSCCGGAFVSLGPALSTVRYPAYCDAIFSTRAVRSCPGANTPSLHDMWAGGSVSPPTLCLCWDALSSCSSRE
jgi:hypothetical protein